MAEFSKPAITYVANATDRNSASPALGASLATDVAYIPHPGGTDLVFVSGQVGHHLDGEPIAQDSAGQARQAFRNLGAILQDLSAGPGQIAGDIVIGDLEYRSLLFPFTSAEDGEHRLIRAASGAPGVRTSDLIAAMTRRTRIVVVSDVLSQDGHRLDLKRLREATDAVGAQLFVDATQSLGALRFDYDRIRPDYLVVHGYNWLLSPRGAAFLVVRDSLVRDMRPLQPNVQSSVDGMYFGGTLSLWPTAARLDTSPAWFSWVGARTALALLSTLDAQQAEERCLGLARQFREAAHDLGYPVLTIRGPGQRPPGTAAGPPA